MGGVLLGAGARSKSSGVVRAREREAPLGRLVPGRVRLGLGLGLG